MRAARLLQMLLLLQNRGRLSCAALAAELEVHPRTILRDIDALTEAGLPIIVHRGNQGGVELGFNYRTRLTGLDASESEALAIVLSTPAPALEVLGLRKAADRAMRKLIESFPDNVRTRIEETQRRFRIDTPTDPRPDPRICAMAEAVRQRRIVRINATANHPRIIHPTGLVLNEDEWAVIDALTSDAPLPVKKWNDINISAKSFA